MTSGLWADLRSGIRALSHRPASTFSALVVLAVGIGGATSTFSVVYATLLRPLPFEEPDRLVAGPVEHRHRSGRQLERARLPGHPGAGSVARRRGGQPMAAARAAWRPGARGGPRRLGHRELLRCAGCACPVRTGVPTGRSPGRRRTSGGAESRPLAVPLRRVASDHRHADHPERSPGTRWSRSCLEASTTLMEPASGPSRR